jgi:hypothetical protein
MSETATKSKFSSLALIIKAGISDARARSEKPTMPTRTRELAP